jgi:hypothetical protein
MSHTTTELMGFFYNMKTCTKCNIEKELTNFGKSKKGKNGVDSLCKCCRKQYYIENKERHSERSREYYLKNKNKIIKRSLKYSLDNKEIIKKKNKKYVLENKEKIRAYQKKWREENKEYLSQYQKKYQSKRIKIDLIFKLKAAIRNRIKHSLKRGTNQIIKCDNTENILGCTIIEFIEYIQSKFTEGMNIENHGKWHLDHIIPLASATTEEEVIRLNHYTNFQPLWAEDNLRKGSKINN